MPKKLCSLSAIHVNCDCLAIMVVGGRTEAGMDPASFSPHAFLLVQTSRRWIKPWRWRALSPMSEGRCWAGVLQLGSPGSDDRTQRVLVAGGGRNTAEILRVDCCDASDLGQWTRIGLLSRPLSVTFLVSQNDRVLAFGELMVTF